jgi:hypothetical protein
MSEMSVTTNEELKELRRRIKNAAPIRSDEEERIKAIDGLALMDSFQLDKVTKMLLPALCDEVEGSDYKLISVDEKIELNRLGESSRSFISAAMCKVGLIADFIITRTRVQKDFSLRMKNYFIGLYAELRKDGYREDGIFTAADQYFRMSLGDIVKASVAMAVMVHYFWKCDVFEKTDSELKERAS